MIDYGIDISTFADLDFDKPIAGENAVLEAVARSLQDAREGIDVRAELNNDLSQSDLGRLAHDIKIAAELDERVIEVKVDLELLSNQAELRIQLGVQLATGIFSLTLSVDALDVSIVEA
jgi:hypothetical protein